MRAVRPDSVPDVGPDAISIKLTRLTGKKEVAPDTTHNLRVTAQTKPGAIAGAIAGKAREGATVINVTGVGPHAVLRMTKGLALARSYVKDDGLDLSALPRFVDLKLGDEERTGVSLDIIVEKI